MVEGGGFEPPKSLTTDLQSVPFGRSGIPPDIEACKNFNRGAGDGTRTRNLLITSQLLCQLSYASVASVINYFFVNVMRTFCKTDCIPELQDEVNIFFGRSIFFLISDNLQLTPIHPSTSSGRTVLVR